MSSKRMKMYSFFVLVVLSMQIFSSRADDVPCPFNKECICSGVAPTTSSLTFDYVKCDVKDGKLPQFDPSPAGKYNINYSFVIDNADLRVFPAKHFAAFEYIGILHLPHKSGSPLESVEINWDDSAFDEVKLNWMYTFDLDGLIPVPAALKGTGMQYLYVSNGHTPISLKDDSFKNLLSLEFLTIYNATIHEIKPNAFSGLEDKLKTIELMYADIRGFVSLKDALKNMTVLRTLNLGYNSITEVNSDSFPEITLKVLHLTSNPIEKIDKRSFTTLNQLRQVSFNSIDTLTSIDLATFTGLQTDVFSSVFYLDKSLKSVVVSDIKGFAKTTTFDISTSGLETIDPKVADLIDKYPEMFLYLDGNVHLKCDGLEWMSKIECPARMLVDDSKCADKQGQKLVDYLKSVDPLSKCKESKNLSRIGQARRKLAPEHGRNLTP